MENKFPNGESVPVLPIKGFGQLTVDAVGVETAAFPNGAIVRITTNAEMFVLITSGTKIASADGNSGARVRDIDTLDIIVGDGEKITAITPSGGATLYWTEFGY
jgi:hypothetical protein